MTSGKAPPPVFPESASPSLLGPYRVTPIANPVTITLDGRPVVAERGEPIAAALAAEGISTIARSPKFHRPRGPACFRAACDGCLARVDGVPNVMTCMVSAAEGTEVITQNRLGPRDTDLLRVTDWFFPDGMNHHELFAGVPGVRSVMQGFARRVAGLGKLPAQALAPRSAARREVDVVIVGAGPSGMAIAQRLLAAGRTVELIDDHASPGGGLRALRLDGHHGFARIASSFDALVARDRVRVHTNAVAGGLYERDLLVVTEAGAEILRAETLVLACGAHDGVCAFEGNDLPGIMSARAAGFLLERGILAGLRPVVVVPPTGGPFGASYIDAFTRRTNASAHADASIELVSGEPVRASGNGRVSSVIVRTTSGEREFVTDAVLVDAPRAPAHELATQAGANLVHEPRGYVVVTDSGRIRPGLYAVGELTGVALDSAAIEADAERVAETIAADRS